MFFGIFPENIFELCWSEVLRSDFQKGTFDKFKMSNRLFFVRILFPKNEFGTKILEIMDETKFTISFK